ncbi:hypothetical protein OUZ56_011243 [Daphnia magna]|uniref:Uncharacterized protein n=1 Tax=Daphnia magna TaxID=35525 RepID=A0ABQ9YZK8_9CRUS|nr:hypothetical protein OUZ56_011243 [Daphnia magna]
MGNRNCYVSWLYTGETHPDWAPSLNLDKVYVNAKSAMDRESRRVILNVQELIATYLRLSEDKRKYAAKLLIVGCDCPYTIHEEYWCNGLSIAGKMPLVTNLDLTTQNMT